MSERFQGIANKGIQIWERLGNWVSSLDPATVEIVFWTSCALAIGVIAFMVLGMMLRGREGELAPDAFLPNDISVVVRDINSKLSNFISANKDEHMFLKQELAELKELSAQTHDFSELEQSLANISARLVSYSNLMREEYSQLRSDLDNIKSAVEGKAPQRGSPGRSRSVDDIL